jgi:hypothetical protein
LAEVGQALPAPRQQRHVPLKKSKVVEGAVDRHIQLPKILTIGLRTTGCCFITAQLLCNALQSLDQLLGTHDILQAKNQIGLCNKRVGPPSEIEISTLREGTKDLIALAKVTGA